MSSHSPRLGAPLFFTAIILIVIAAWGIIGRLHEAAAAKNKTETAAIPVVNVIPAKPAPANEDIVLPGTVRPLHEAPIYARTNGYVKVWHTDIGAHVKAGDLLAELDTPDVDAQLHQAEADLQTAEAINAQSQSTAAKFRAVTNRQAVSQQEVDAALNDAAAKAAAVVSARENANHLRELEGFRRVVAPFDGVITVRNTDTGALINAGQGGAPAELFHIVAADRLRIDVEVPQNYASYITPDLAAELHFAEYPDRIFPATLARTADALDPTTRTLQAEFELDNSKGELKAGGFTEVHLKLNTTNDNIRLPVNTLLFRDGMQVATIDATGHALLKPVTIGRDYGKEVEIVSGLSADENVIVNPPDSLTSGQAVKVAQPVATPAAAPITANALQPQPEKKN